MIIKDRLQYIIILTAIFIIAFTSSISADIYDTSTLNYEEKLSYDEYLELYKDYNRPEQEIIISAMDYKETDMEVEIIQGLGGKNLPAIKVEEEGYIEYEFYVEEAGLYNISLDYFPVQGRSSDIVRGLKVNGEYPFDGVEYLNFPRIWVDGGDIRVDNQGNEISPPQVEAPQWQTVNVSDSLGYYNDPYLFFFEKGYNTITFVSQKEPMAIAQIKIFQVEERPTYSDYIAEYKAKGYKEVKNVFVKVQAEDAARKSTPTIYPIADQADPKVEPYHHALIRLNTIGRDRWKYPGEWVEWEFEVPEAGLYKIGLKAKQNLNRGGISARRLYVNGEIPFQEVETINFKYSSNYEMYVLGDNEPYLFYLDKGKNTIRLEAILGDMASIIREAEELLFDLNTAFRQIIMITSSNPDRNRDYQLEKRIPQVLENLGKSGRQLRLIADQLEVLSGETGQQIARLREISRQMIDMSERPRTIQKRIGHFRDNLGNLGEWIMTAKEQPLTLDYLVIASPEMKMPETKATFFQTVKHELKKYFASYFINYDLVGDVYDKSELKQEPLTVWVAMGRDQAQILKRMIEDDFTPQTGIYVNMELVNLGVLLPATLAGRGPDVALGIESNAPINFAMRNAVLDLTQFDDFEEVAQRFHKSALVPFTFRDHVYALPQQHQFPVLFYRKDVLAELGLGIPQTWDDVFKIIPELKENNMEFGFPVSDVAARRAVSADIGMTTAGAGSLSAHPGVTPFLTFIYQMGGDLYLPDGVATDLHNEIAVEAFRMWTDFYELYKLPLAFNPQNRFRTGEMPLVINNYPFYSILEVFAPEIKGKWGFTLVPGTMREDGTIDRTIPGGAIAGGAGAADMILLDSDLHEEAWEFLKWWSSTETQARYGRELESMLGVAARFPTANLEATHLLPWTIDELNILHEQWQYVKGVPEVPGGYMTGRHLENAFRKVINEQEDSRKMLLDYVRIIEEEIELKRDEFGLETDIDAILDKYKEDPDLYIWW